MPFRDKLCTGEGQERAGKLRTGGVFPSGLNTSSLALQRLELLSLARTPTQNCIKLALFLAQSEPKLFPLSDVVR